MIPSLVIGAIVVSLFNSIFYRRMTMGELVVLDALFMVGALVIGMLRHG